MEEKKGKRKVEDKIGVGEKIKIKIKRAREKREMSFRDCLYVGEPILIYEIC